MEDDKTTQESSAAAAPPLRSLADYAVGPIPTLLYVPGFISDAEQSQLLHHVFLPGLLAFFFLCVCLCDLVVLMRLVLAGGWRFTRRQRPSGSRSRTGGCRTGVRVTLFSEVWSLAWKSPYFSPFLLLCNEQGFEFLTEFDLLVSAGGVVHEKGLLPQACEYIAIKACKF